MNRYHREILANIQKHAERPGRSTESPKYHGTEHIHYLLTNPALRFIAKEFAKNHKDISQDELTTLLDSLFCGASYEEKTVGGKLLQYYPKLRKQLSPNFLDRWLNELVGWAEIDSLCQSVFTEKEMLADWKTWEQLLLRFSQDKNINKRRASLVLLTDPTSHSDDERLTVASLKIIDTLTHEKDILITKAISWLLRSMIGKNRVAVTEYLQEHETILPKIAVRETKRKLLTGKK